MEGKCGAQDAPHSQCPRETPSATTVATRGCELEEFSTEKNRPSPHPAKLRMASRGPLSPKSDGSGGHGHRIQAQLQSKPQARQEPSSPTDLPT